MFHSCNKVIFTNLFRLHKSRRMQFHSAYALLAGHSKWANIKHIKAQKDGQKAVQFTKLSRQLRLAVQEGGSGDPALNSILRSVVDEALRKNMPMSTIQNSIKKTVQNELKKSVLELRFKQKVFAICIVYTDNLPALKMEMATILRKAGATFTNVAHMFEEDGLIETSMDNTTFERGIEIEERATEDAIECGAEDVDIIDKSTGAVNVWRFFLQLMLCFISSQFICRPIEINMVRKAIADRGYSIQNAECIYTAKNSIELSPEEAKAYEIFLRKLRDLPGVEDIYDNVNF